jgi:hypothetical protein
MQIDQVKKVQREEERFPTRMQQHCPRKRFSVMKNPEENWTMARGLDLPGSAGIASSLLGD